jgi:hypothetical protein
MLKTTNLTTEEFLEKLNNYVGKKVEISISSDNMPSSINIYRSFGYIMNDEINIVVLVDDLCDKTQMMDIDLNKVNQIKYSDKGNIYDNWLDLIFDNYKIGITSKEEKMICCMCGKICEEHKDRCWTIQGHGNYGSLNEGNEINEHICDDCACRNILHIEHDYCPKHNY